MRTLLIDGNNFLFAAQHNGSKLTAGEQEVTAIFGFLGSLRNVMERFPGSIPIVLWDASPSWRFDLYQDYKANRDKNPQLVKTKEALRSQRPIIKDLLNQMGVRQFSIPNQEADDLAAHLSRELSSRGGQVVLVTRDGDWQQLVKDNVVWYDHRNNKVIDTKNFEEETGYLDTQRFVQAKAIHGDNSDNIPGVGGLGEGAAKIILSEFATLRDMAGAWPVFSATIGKGHPWSRYKKKIQAALDDPKLWDRFALNLRLMDLGAVEYRRDQYQTTARYNEAAVKQLMGQYGFHSILRRYDQWLEPIKKGLVDNG